MSVQRFSDSGLDVRRELFASDLRLTWWRFWMGSTPPVASMHAAIGPRFVT
jgi:hypothetical protein